MKICLISIILIFATVVLGQNLTNQVSIGGTGEDFLSVHRINDGSGYYLIGSSNSNISGNKTENSKGLYDYWILKTDNNFAIEWDKTIGGSATDRVTGALVSDNGIFVLGYSDSDISGDKTMNSYGSSDIWLLRLADDGTVVWQEQYGGDQYEASLQMLEYTDTSLLIMGSSDSGVSGNKTVVSVGSAHTWLLEVSKQNGAIIQQKAIGTANNDLARCLAKNPYNNHIYLGANAFIGISGDKSENGYGSEDAWLIELDESLNIVNEKVFGGSLSEKPISGFVFQENYIYAITYSSSGVSGNKTSPIFGPTNPYSFYDLWLLKLNYDLSIVWDKSYGGSKDEYSNVMIPLSNGNIVVPSSSKSEATTGNKTAISHGSNQFDVWLLVVLPDGEIASQVSFGGALGDFIDVAIEGNNNELIISSFSNSPISGNKTVSTWGGNDAWIGKINIGDLLSHTTVLSDQFELFPNPTTDELFMNGNFSASSYKIIDMSGKTIISENIQTSALKIDVSSLQAGMYLLQLDEHQFKFIKR